MHGLHLTADLYDCHCPLALLTDSILLADFCRNETIRAGLTIVGEQWHTFPGVDEQGCMCEQAGGVTGVLLLAESHLAIHTWPERQGVTLDIYVCNFSADNSARARELLQVLLTGLQPQRCQQQQLWRGLETRPQTSD
jgi:spermidine synthase